VLEDAQAVVGLSEDKPVGQIQIRLPNNERIIGSFNEDHTVDDVRSFIVA
jgi:hypothetical protein